MGHAVRVKLTVPQFEYLKRLASNAELPPGLEFGSDSLEGRPDEVEALRGKLTELLALRGFAEDYSTNDEGQIIEELIDRLHLP